MKLDISAAGIQPTKRLGTIEGEIEFSDGAGTIDLNAATDLVSLLGDGWAETLFDIATSRSACFDN